MSALPPFTCPTLSRASSFVSFQRDVFPHPCLSSKPKPHIISRRIFLSKIFQRDVNLNPCLSPKPKPHIISRQKMAKYFFAEYFNGMSIRICVFCRTPNRTIFCRVARASTTSNCDIQNCLCHYRQQKYKSQYTFSFPATKYTIQILSPIVITDNKNTSYNTHTQTKQSEEKKYFKAEQKI